MIWDVVLSCLAEITYWRNEARKYHALACQRGDYLTLTFTIRSTLAETTEIDGIDAEEELDEVEDWLANYQEILMSIKRHEAGNTGLNTILRVLKQ